MEKNVVGWFEIPVSDMDRAVRFYEALMQTQLERHTMGLLDMAWFPYAESGIGSPGSLVYNPEWYKPSSDGVLIYLTTPTGDLDSDLARVENAGGKIVTPKRQISEEYGYMAVFLDTEGNRVALHARM